MTPIELKNLNNEINRLEGKAPYRRLDSNRILTKEEWENLKIAIPNYAMYLHNTGFGFSLGFSLYDAPSYPGINPEFLIAICQKQIPLKTTQAPTGGSPKAAYDLLYPMASTDRNIELLKFCKIDLPKPLSYYEY